MYKLAVFALLVASVAALPRSFRRVPGGGKIVGGEDAQVGQFPYQISLLWSGSHICGGSVIGPNLVVTAAHCVEGDSPSVLAVIAGKHRRTVTGPNEQRRQVSRIVVHENYNSNTFANDIALLHVAEAFDFSGQYVKPIGLPSHQEAAPRNIIVSGWGTTRSGGQLADILQWVQLPTIADADCGRMYPNEDILDSMMCAGLPEGGKDSCQGDSGGPLATTDGTKLHGIVSWGYGCAAPNYPGVNTEVSYFVNWIGANGNLIFSGHAN